MEAYPNSYAMLIREAEVCRAGLNMHRHDTYGIDYCLGWGRKRRLEARRARLEEGRARLEEGRTGSVGRESGPTGSERCNTLIVSSNSIVLASH